MASTSATIALLLLSAFTTFTSVHAGIKLTSVLQVDAVADPVTAVEPLFDGTMLTADENTGCFLRSVIVPEDVQNLTVIFTLAGVTESSAFNSIDICKHLEKSNNPMRDFVKAMKCPPKKGTHSENEVCFTQTGVQNTTPGAPYEALAIFEGTRKDGTIARTTLNMGVEGTENK